MTGRSGPENMASVPVSATPAKQGVSDTRSSGSARRRSRVRSGRLLHGKRSSDRSGEAARRAGRFSAASHSAISAGTSSDGTGPETVLPAARASAANRATGSSSARIGRGPLGRAASRSGASPRSPPVAALIRARMTSRPLMALRVPDGGWRSASSRPRAMRRACHPAAAGGASARLCPRAAASPRDWRAHRQAPAGAASA